MVSKLFSSSLNAVQEATIDSIKKEKEKKEKEKKEEATIDSLGLITTIDKCLDIFCTRFPWVSPFREFFRAPMLTKR